MKTFNSKLKTQNLVLSEVEGSKLRTQVSRLKTIYLFCLLASGCFLFVGCQPGNARNDKKVTYSRAAGIWKADRLPYVIKITDETKLEWAIVDPGSVKVYPHKRVEFPMKDDSTGYFETGDCPVEFNSETGELSVEINVKKLMIPFIDDKLEGHVQHIFTGLLNEDGTVWDTTWLEIFDYGPRFPMDPKGIEVGVAVKFTRVDE